MKTCTKCKIEKPLDEYHRQKAGKYGRRGECKTCVSVQRAEYNARPEVKARQALLYAENKEGVLSRQAEYRARPDVKERNAEYMAGYNAEYYAENRDRERARAAEHYAANPHVTWESNARKRAKHYGYTPVIESFTREELIARWGNECFHCKGEWTELDHWPIPTVRGGHHVIENCRPSCAPCNWKSWRQDV